jgi:leucyl/phenylalanyl-tRNA--protein transferase
MKNPDNPFDRGYFPHATLVREDGLLAVGGILETEVLLEAYSKGVFPWYSEGSPVLWWSPDPRMVLFPDEFKVSKSLMQTIRNRQFEVGMDTVFENVIRQCAVQPRSGQRGTWITPDMIEAYIRLHNEGYAHSVEIFSSGELVGGLYGISLGTAFFGESMFHIVRDASKVALYHLVEFARRHDFQFIDAQQSTPHLKRLGAADVARKDFLALLDKSISMATLRGKWSAS